MSLPAGWEQAEADGEVYYYNETTGETSWEFPADGDQGEDVGGYGYDQDAGGGGGGGGGGEWSEVHADDGTPYYYNETTGETRWEAPPGFNAPAAAPQQQQQAPPVPARPTRPRGPAPAPRRRGPPPGATAAGGPPVAPPRPGRPGSGPGPVVHAPSPPAESAASGGGYGGGDGDQSAATATPQFGGGGGGVGGSEPLSKQGYLTKEGHVRKNWKRRWFVLRDRTLSYYRSMADGEAAGSVQLGGARIEPAPQKKRGDLCLGILQSPKNLYIVADNQQDYDEWKATLEEAASR